jgi:hypothetical protein
MKGEPSGANRNEVEPQVAFPTSDNKRRQPKMDSQFYLCFDESNSLTSFPERLGANSLHEVQPAEWSGTTSLFRSNTREGALGDSKRSEESLPMLSCRIKRQPQQQQRRLLATMKTQEARSGDD